MFKLEAVDSSFLGTAQHRFVFPIELGASADEVWEGLVGERPLGWCRWLTHVGFTSPSPHGPGSTRRSEVARGALKFRERFFVWEEEARHHSFFVEEVNLPLLRAFAEDYRVTPTDSGCTFTWTFAFEAKPGFGAALKLGLPAIQAQLRSFARDTERAFGTRRP